MEQKVSHRKVILDGSGTDEVLLSIKDKKYSNILIDVSMTVEDAMELHRLLENKLGEIPA